MLEQKFMEEVFKRFDKIDAKLDEHSKNIKELKADVSTLKDIVNTHDEKLDKIDKLQATVDTHGKKLDELQADFKMHDKVLVNIEYQVTEKIPTLFDAFTYNQDKHKEYEDSLDAVNSKLFNHDIRISSLEDNFKSSKILKV